MREPADEQLVPPPARGRVFEREVTVGLGDAAPSGRARLDAIARWLQDVAYLDVVHAGLADRGSWVVRRLRMVVTRFPRFGEALRLRTFCSAAANLAAERRTTLGGDQAAVEAVALWVFLDDDSRRPARLGDEFEAVYGEAAGGRRVRSRLRHPAPPAGAHRRGWTFRASDLDVAEHVNNAAYWQPVEELLAGEEPGAADVEIEFRDPAQAGDVSLLRAGDMLWIASPAGTLHASIAGLPSVS